VSKKVARKKPANKKPAKKGTAKSTPKKGAQGSPGNPLSRINCIVQLMLENRSFDQMLGFLYADHKNVAPTTGQPFDGLTGNEANSDENGKPVRVFKIGAPNPDVPAADGHPYHMPGCDPGEHFQDVNEQLFGVDPAPVRGNPSNQGFVKSFAKGIVTHKGFKDTLPGTVSAEIMGAYPPEMLPVMSALARGFAVCDRWFASVPTQTFPNRAFASAATSLGYLKNYQGMVFNCPSIFGRLSDANIDWAIFGYDGPPLTRTDFPDTKTAARTHFGVFSDFQKRAAAGTLPAYTFLEPNWGAAGNSQHPNYDVALGEQLMLDVYRALRSSPQWNQTLLVITYDEHGGNYDHVAPPTGAVAPDDHVGEFESFGFSRFGVRIPALLISPWIPEGTVFRVPTGTIDHTSVLKTIEDRWGVPALTRRDAAAPSLAGVLSLAKPRTDDPLANVRAPVAKPDVKPNLQLPSSIEKMHAARVAALDIPSQNGFHSVPEEPDLSTSAKIHKYIATRMQKWDDYLEKNGRGEELRRRQRAARTQSVAAAKSKNRQPARP
jgi:phospholipase C